MDTNTKELIAKLRYMGRQYAAGQESRGGGVKKHYLEEAADRLEGLLFIEAMEKTTPGSQQENANLRNVVQAALSGGIPAMLETWAKYFPDHPLPAPKAVESEQARPEKPKMAPVQGYAPGIPWALHLEAYEVYSKKWRPQEALINGNCRGGFHVDELNEFVPGWRDRIAAMSASGAPAAAPAGKALRMPTKEEWANAPGHFGPETGWHAPIEFFCRINGLPSPAGSEERS